MLLILAVVTTIPDLVPQWWYHHTCVHRDITSLVVYRTPATTNVAACMTADTEVGPSIASGSQLCNPIKTLLTPTIRRSRESMVLHVGAVVWT